MKRNLLLLLVATLFATISLPAYVVLISTILSLHSLIFIENIINELLEENEALRADLKKMAETRNDCSVCDHYNIDGPRPDCELNGWHCEWKWRGVERYKKEELFE